MTIGPVCYTIFTEVSATKLRTKTIAVAMAAQALVGIVMTVAIPYTINPDQANMRGKLGFFYGMDYTEDSKFLPLPQILLHSYAFDT